jgi:hypothetical protein
LLISVIIVIKRRRRRNKMSREEDIKRVLNFVVNQEPIFFDAPNGAYELSCPYCYEMEERGWDYVKNPTTMKTIKHDEDCIYLVAKDLLTK